MSNSTYASRFVGSLIGIALLAGLAYACLGWLGVDVGSLTEWGIGLLVLWWLIVVVTLPWDLYFKARGILDDTTKSRAQGLTVADQDVAYVRRWARLSLGLAVALHLVTAAGLYLLSQHGIGRIGLFGAGAALLLMALRPAGRAYEYLLARLTSIGHETRFPRDDVLDLRQRLEAAERAVKQLEHELDLKHDCSWAGQVASAAEALAAKVEGQRAALEDLRQANDDAHRRLAREAEQATARLTEDARVLSNVRELVRFFKEA